MIFFSFFAVAQEKLNWQDYLEVKDSHFKHKKKRKINLIEYLPRFKNISDRKIIDIRFTTEFINNLGEPVYKMSGKIVQNLKANRNSSKKEFYLFPDNPYNSNDTYDQLKPLTDIEEPIENVLVKSIRFENGDILKFQ